MIDEDLVILDSPLTNKDEIIRYLAEKAEESGYLANVNHYIQAVKKREAEFSTALGYDVCIPHGKSRAVKNPFVCFLRTKQKIQWDYEGNPVELVFLLGIPEEHKTTLHLKILAEISKKLLSEAFRLQLLKGDREAVLTLLYQVENNIINNKEV